MDNITHTEDYFWEYTCTRPSDYYNERCSTCSARNPNHNCEYLRIKYTVKWT